MTAAHRQMVTELRYLHQRLAERLDPDGHGAAIDAAVSGEIRELALVARERVLERLRLLRGAIARIDAGVYGRCLDCHSPIGAPRLKAIPTAERCVGCQASAERAACVERTGARDVQEDD